MPVCILGAVGPPGLVGHPRASTLPRLVPWAGCPNVALAWDSQQALSKGRERGCTKPLGSHGKQMLGNLQPAHICSSEQLLFTHNSAWSWKWFHIFSWAVGWKAQERAVSCLQKPKAFINVQTGLNKATKMSACNFSLSSQLCWGCRSNSRRQLRKFNLCFCCLVF